MTTEELKMLQDLHREWIAAGGVCRPKKLSRFKVNLSEIRRGFPSEKICNVLLDEVIDGKSAAGLEALFGIFYMFGLPVKKEVLVSLVFEVWHKRHEDVIIKMANQCDSYFVDSLIKFVHWVPDYLLGDNQYALSKRALYALADIDDPRAKSELEKISKNYWDSYLSDVASHLLES